jgi:serine/threonine-protein kinase RsbW
MDTELAMSVYSARLPVDPSSVAAARRLASYSFGQWQLIELIDEAHVVISELVTNAILASSAEAVMVRAFVSLYNAKVRIEVWDEGDGKPQVQPLSGDNDGGRGLVLVEALSAQWGWYTPAGLRGKFVWADLTLPADLAGATVIPAPAAPRRPVDLALLSRVRDGLRDL